MKTSKRYSWAPVCCVALLLMFGAEAQAAGGPKTQPPVPDLTAGGTIDTAHDWTLGATGLRGWMYAWKLETTESRQIYVTEVAPASPAANVFKVGDVILGINITPFASDARRAMEQAVTQAEAKGGVLYLIRWRDGKRTRVKIQMEALGSYSPTAPYNCPKSDRIFEKGCAAIAANIRADASGRNRGNPMTRSLNALALLASDEKKYMPLIKEEAKWASEYWVPEVKGFQSWWYGYVNLFLAEYVMATGDPIARTAMERMSTAIAEGQSGVGTWGHVFAFSSGGRLQGYGAMNAPGLSLTLSLAAAREAGFKSPLVEEAIRKSALFLRFYVDKGAIPYGDHHPWFKTHDDNGKSSVGAVLFDLLGDAEAATFFSRMATASYGAERDTGHTGNFINLLWALPGVARSGPHATGAWMKEMGGYYDLARKWDGTFVYQGEPGISNLKYGQWDSTGAYLMSYALAKKSLWVSGKKASKLSQVNAVEAQALIEDGRGWMPIAKAASYSERTNAALKTGLSSWSPVVRNRSALVLGERAAKWNENELNQFVDMLLALLESDDLYSNYGACEAFEKLGKRAVKALEPLRQTLSSDDLWLRVMAGEALSSMGAEASSAVPDLLKLMAQTDVADDPRGMTQRYLAFLLFHPGRMGDVRGMLAHSLDGVDRDLLYTAVRAGLLNDDGRARGTLASVYDQLSYAEIVPLLPAIYQAVAEPSPSGVMFASGIRLRGLALLSKYKIKEGIPHCIPMLQLDKWGKQARMKPCLDALKAYGGAAKSELPALRQAVADLKVHKEAIRFGDFVAELEAFIVELENDNLPTPKLRSLPLRSTEIQ